MPSALGAAVKAGSEDKSLASASLLLGDAPAATATKLPRYRTVPAVRMGRLAGNQSSQGQGLGGALLADALDRAARSGIAAHALCCSNQGAADLHQRAL